MDPSRLLRAVPLGAKIPKLKQRVEKLFTDVNAQEKACESCSRIFRTDAGNVVRHGHRMLRRGLKVRVVSGGSCGLCARGLFEGDLVLFKDGYVYHQSCLQQQANVLGDLSSSPGVATSSASSFSGNAALSSGDWRGGSLVRGHVFVYAKGQV